MRGFIKGVKTMAQGKRVAVAERPTHSGKRHLLRNFVLAIMLLSGLYGIAVFSNVPIIEKWRTIYIETAMGTMTHQWLATAFIPKSVIDKAMDQRFSVEDAQNGLSTGKWSITLPSDNPCRPWSKLKTHFLDLYEEIDQESFEAYLNKNGESLDEDGYLVIDRSARDAGGTSIVTKQGDKVLAIDTHNGIVIVLRKTGDFVARLAIIKDPAQVSVGLAPDYGKVGATVQQISEEHGAVLGINASGFYDPEGHGNGAEAYGLMISNGKKLSSTVGSNYKMLGFNKKNVLNIGRYKDTDFFRDAVEFKPILVLDGEQQIEGSAGWGIQPRSAIGQSKSGAVLMLIVDGRAPGYSIGATMGDLAEMMLDYEAEQAINLDGGSSSVMYFRGKVISKPSAGNKADGRRLPNAFIVSAR